MALMANGQTHFESTIDVGGKAGATFSKVNFNPSVKQTMMPGFTVGAKSGQFSNEQDGYDTLANNTANGFKCMIYARKELEQ